MREQVWSYPLYDSSFRLLLSKVSFPNPGMKPTETPRLKPTSSRSQSARSQMIQYITVETMSLDAIINRICSAEGSSKTASQNFTQVSLAQGSHQLALNLECCVTCTKNRTDAVGIGERFCLLFLFQGKKQREQHFVSKQHRHHFLSLDDQSHSCRQIFWMVVVDLLSIWILYPKSQSLYRITRIEETIANRFEKQGAWTVEKLKRDVRFTLKIFAIIGTESCNNRVLQKLERAGPSMT